MAFAATATAVGIGAGTLGVAAPYKQAHDLFRQQINQDRRFFVADWAETSWRHSEALAQTERHHAEDYMLALTQYWQSDKIHRREFRQNTMIHQREVDIMLRAETREALRDELLFQNNRMNNVQLCSTVCLGVAFTVAVEGVMPPESSQVLVNMYSGCIGAAILCLSASLWLSFILIRRLNLYTAGIMHAMIDMERVKRERSILDQFDPVATSEEFQAWLQRHCVWLRTSSLFALSTGVIVLFAASGTLVQGRFNHSFETRQVTATIIFWSFAAATVLFIIVLELKEHVSSKQKSGVYSMKWKDALRNRRHRFQQDAAELSKLGEDVRDKIHREVEQQEQASYSQCPDAGAVAERGARFSKLAVDRRLMRGKTRSVIFETLDLPGDTWTPEETKSQLRDVVQEVRNLDEQHANNVDSNTRKQPLSSLFSQAAQLSDDDAGSEAGAAAATVTGDMPIVDASGQIVDMQLLRKLAGQYFRSTLVHVRNGTDSEITLKLKTMFYGVFEEEIGEYNLKVPIVVPAKGEGVFLARGRPFAGVSGEVEYVTRDRCWSFKLRWSNFVLVGDDGRFCETEVVRNAEEEHRSDDRYRVYKEDDDQTVNNEVYFSIKTVARDEAARSWQDSGPIGTSAIKADWVQIKPFSDWVWVKRWVSLTGQKLAYYASKTEKIKEGQLYISEVTDVFPSGPTELTLAGDEHSQRSWDNEEQQLPLRMWFASTADRDAWMDALMIASPLLASWNRTSSLSLDAALDELAKKQIECFMNFDQLLALYYRIIHGDKQKVIGMQQTFSAASKLTADEATEAMLLVLIRMLTEEQLHHERAAAAVGDNDSQRDQLADDRTENDHLLPAPNDVPDRSFSASEWVAVVERWGGANVWTGLRTRDKVLLVGQRLLDSGLIVAALQHEEQGSDKCAVFSEEKPAGGSPQRYSFVPVQCACSAAALATANIHAPAENGADESSTGRFLKRDTNTKTAGSDDETFTASEATEWLLARGGNVQHDGGPTGFCEQLHQCGLLTRAACTVESSDDAEQRYSVRRCANGWKLHLVPAEAAAAAQVLSDTGATQPPDTPSPASYGHGHEDSTLHGSLADHLHTPSRAEFLRHAAADGNETMSRSELIAMLVAESIPIHDDYLESIFPTPDSVIEYDTFLKVYSTFQKIHAGQQQFQQHKDEIQAGTRSRFGQTHRDAGPKASTKPVRP